MILLFDFCYSAYFVISRDFITVVIIDKFKVFKKILLFELLDLILMISIILAGVIVLALYY